MNKRDLYKISISLGAAVVLCLLLVTGCHLRRDAEAEEGYDLPQIQEKGELTVLTLYSSTSYFLYRGESMGYQYELCRQFAESLGLQLRVQVANSPEELIQKLLNKEGDLIAFNLPITHEWKDSVRYCGEETITHQVVVQRKGRAALTDVTELVGKEVYVKPGRTLQRLQNLDRELGGGVLIHEVPEDSISNEDLITMVAQGQIDYMICDNDLARINRTYYLNLDISLQVSFMQRSAWAVRKDEPLLAQAADEWHQTEVKSMAYLASARRYFDTSKRVAHGSILSVKDGRISLYDDLFKKYAGEIDWDWRLLASLAYTESNFDPTAVSWAGAKGLMQLMPRTARLMGVPEGKEQDPEESIKAATKYIAAMERSFANVTDPEERVCFILASYNAGLGHIRDAMALALKYGADPNRWQNHTEKYLLLKSHEQYFNDPVCKNGYFRGVDTYEFVHEILQRYKVYQETIH
jgi:membrane-bound lytic murein transglycosylase F